MRIFMGLTLGKLILRKTKLSLPTLTKTLYCPTVFQTKKKYELIVATSKK